MSQATIEIKFKNVSEDPAAKQVRAELIELGQASAQAQVIASRLFRIEGRRCRHDLADRARPLG